MVNWATRSCSWQIVKKGTDENGVSSVSATATDEKRRWDFFLLVLSSAPLCNRNRWQERRWKFCSLFFFLSSVSFYYRQRWQKRTVELLFPFSVSSFLHSVINPIPKTECKPDITNPKAQTINLTSKNVMWLLCTKIYKKCARKQKERNWKFHWHTCGTYTISLL